MVKVVINGGYTLRHGVRVANEFEPAIYGRLTAIGPAFSLSTSGKWRRRWFQVFQCNCGTILPVCLESIVTGACTSCGCYASEVARTRSLIHGMRKSPEYKSWSLAKSRCYCQRRDVFKYYGGRGIRICERWLESNGQGFINFLADMGRKPSIRHTLDRIDVNGDYCPENCVWSTPVEQGRNKRNNVLLTHEGKTLCIAEWSEITGISANCIRYRKKRGWSDEKALTTPVRITRKVCNGQ
jgi:hypothetical protein